MVGLQSRSWELLHFRHWLSSGPYLPRMDGKRSLSPAAIQPRENRFSKLWLFLFSPTSCTHLLRSHGFMTRYPGLRGSVGTQMGKLRHNHISESSGALLFY
jgi:hypothetical protein